MEMQRPSLDGLEATQQIRRISEYSTIPILAMTANAFLDDRQRCLAAGMDDVVVKPIEPDGLSATLLHWLSRGRKD